MTDQEYVESEYSKEFDSRETERLESFLRAAMAGSYKCGVIKFKFNGKKIKWDVYGRLLCILSSANSDISAVRHSTVDFWRREVVNPNAPFLRRPMQVTNLLIESSNFKRFDSKKTRSTMKFKTRLELKKEAQKVEEQCSTGERFVDIKTYLERPRNENMKYWHSTPEFIDTFIQNENDKQVLWSMWIQQAFRRGILLDVMNKSKNPEEIDLQSRTRATKNFDTLALSMCNEKTDDKIKDIVKQIFEEVPVDDAFLEYNMKCICQRELEVDSKTKTQYVCQVPDQSNPTKWKDFRETSKSVMNDIKKKYNPSKKIHNKKPKKRQREASSESSTSSSEEVFTVLRPPSTAPAPPPTKRRLVSNVALGSTKTNNDTVFVIKK